MVSIDADATSAGDAERAIAGLPFAGWVVAQPRRRPFDADDDSAEGERDVEVNLLRRAGSIWGRAPGIDVEAFRMSLVVIHVFREGARPQFFDFDFFAHLRFLLSGKP